MTKNILTIGCACLFWAGILFASDTSSVDREYERQLREEARALAETKPMHFVSFLFLPNPSVENSTLGRAVSLFYTSEEQDFRINAFSGSITRTIRYDGPRELVLFDKELDAAGEEVKIPKVRIDLGSPGEKMVILTNDSGDRLMGMVVPTDKRNFPENVVRVFNFSAQVVRVQVQNEVKDMTNMRMDDFAVEVKQPRDMVGFTVAAFKDGSGYLVARRRIGMPYGGRQFIVLFPNPSNPDRLTFTNLAIAEGPFLRNYSNEALTAAEVEYSDTYVPAARR
jgi:hypothetical protein